MNIRHNRQGAKALSNGKRKYRIQAVAEMTGVSAATLRAWERRYGIPVPHRTDAAYRIYTDEDVTLVRRLRALIDGGMAASQAAELVLSELQHVPKPTAHNDDPFGATRNAIVHAVLRFDPETLESALAHAMLLGSASTIFDRIIAPVMLDIGTRWENGTLSIAQEHLASVAMEVTARKLLGLVQPPALGPRVLLACFPEEIHTVPLLGVALHLASSGFRITELGARTPPHAIREAVEQLDPLCVGLSVTVPPGPPTARSIIAAYAAACGDTPWIVGGRGLSDLAGLVHEHGGVAAQWDGPKNLVQIVEAVANRRRR